jgi:hypothetical protein
MANSSLRGLLWEEYYSFLMCQILACATEDYEPDGEQIFDWHDAIK